jgi:chromatin assembly factor 1 subunit A
MVRFFRSNMALLQSQMSLNAFLSRPSASVSATRRRTVTPDGDMEPAMKSVPISQASSKTDYERTFAPFHIKPHVTMAPRNRWRKGGRAIEESLKMIDECLKIQNNPNRPARATAPTISELRCILPSKRPVQGTTLRYTVKEIMAKLIESTRTLGTGQNQVKISSSSRHTKRHYGPLETELFKSVPMKCLKFYDDARPPYRGTLTKQPPAADIMRFLSRNPNHRKLSNINYDYDSEAEWDPEEEGEDLDSEGEQEDVSDDDADDMEEFLDDEDAPEASGAVNKRRPVLSDLVPVCSGLCWGDETKMDNGDLNDYKIEVILSMSLIVTLH